MDFYCSGFWEAMLKKIMIRMFDQSVHEDSEIVDFE